MPAPQFSLNKGLRITALSRLARAGLAFAIALIALALAACGPATDDGRTPPPTTAPAAEVESVTPIPTFPDQGGRGESEPATSATPIPAPATAAPTQAPVVAPIVTAVIATPTPVPREIAPAFDLPAGGGGNVSLSQMLDGSRAAVLVFYRGLF